MSSFNHITLVGRLTADPELKTTTAGKSVCSFSLAVDNYGKDSGATFFRCQAWDKTAEFAAKYLTKGRVALVDGRIQSRKFKDKDGNEREVFEVTARDVQGLDKPKETTKATEDEYDPFA